MEIGDQSQIRGNLENQLGRQLVHGERRFFFPFPFLASSLLAVPMTEEKIDHALPNVWITNVVATYKLKVWDQQRRELLPWNVSLPEFIERTEATPNVFCKNLYQDKRFPAAKLVLSARRQHVPLVTFLYFKKGKVVQIGARSAYESRRQTALFTTFVLKVFHQEIEPFDFKIRNVCVSGKLRGPLDLDALHEVLKPKGRSTYQPSGKGAIDSFPALIGVVNPAEKKRVFTLYATGSFNLVGNKETLDWREGQKYMALVERHFQATAASASQRKKRGLLQRQRSASAERHVRALSHGHLLDQAPRSKRRRLTNSEVGRLPTSLLE